MKERHIEGDSGTTANGLARRGTVFAFCLLFWLLLVLPAALVEGGPFWGDAVAGLVAAAMVTLVSGAFVTQRFVRMLQPARYFWAAVFLAVFVYYVVKANVDVAYRVLHPVMPIRPGIVRASATLRTASARTLLANCITLTPGTLTIDIAATGSFYIHWINVQTLEDEEAKKLIIGRFEWFIRKILE